MKSRSAVQFREIPEDQIDEALALAYLVFHNVPDDGPVRKHHQEALRTSLRVGAYDGDQLVGLTAALPFELSVPGGELPCPALTFVSVAPTHRRRGVLSGMIAELYARCGERGAPLAALWASEASIYGRFGFGPGTYGATVEIDARRPLDLRIEPDERPLRLVDPAKAPGVLAAYYDGTRAARAGRPARSETWWRENWLPEKDEDDEEFSPPRVVTLGEPLAGYAIYRTKAREDSPALVRVDELEADSPAVAAALWSYLAAIDLADTVRAWGRPLDDPLLLFAADRDQVRVTSDFPALWVRLVDVRAALEARSWAAPADLVLEVADERLPANAGRHRLTASPESCAYAPTDAAPDLTLAVRDLAACYLGGTRVADLVAAGVVTEHTPGAADTFDAALRTPRLPHTVEEF